VAYVRDAKLALDGLLHGRQWRAWPYVLLRANMGSALYDRAAAAARA